MTMPLLGRIVKRLAFVPFLLTLASPTWAQEEERPAAGYAKDGLFVGASTLLNFSFSGDTFDGESAYIREGGEEVVILPRFDGAHNVMPFAITIRNNVPPVAPSAARRPISCVLCATV